jgi:hypothetical protein
MDVGMCPSKGRQGENHISTFLKLSKGRDDEFFLFSFFLKLINYSKMDDKEKSTLTNSKAL